MSHVSTPSSSRGHSSDPSSRQKRTPRTRENGQSIQLRNREGPHLLRQGAQLTLQTTRHILRRNLIEQADDVIRVGTQQAVLHAHDTSTTCAQRVEVVGLARVAAEEDRRAAVHGDEIVRDVREGKGREAVVPVIRDALAAAEDEGVAGFLGAEERADVQEVGRRDVAVCEVREEAEEEGGGAVEQDYLGAVVEVGVLGDGLLVALAHEFDHVGQVKVVACGDGHCVEEGAVEGEVIRSFEEVVGAGERGIGFEFLWG